MLPNGDGLAFEQIAALQPDLILALYVPSGLTQEDYNRLSQIAPTVAPPAGETEGGISWQDLTRTVGLAVGQPDEAERIVADVEARFVRTGAGGAPRVHRRDRPERVPGGRGDVPGIPASRSRWTVADRPRFRRPGRDR